MVWLATVAFLSLVVQQFVQAGSARWKTLLIPILFISVFSGHLFISAGIVANVTNYYLPMIACASSFCLQNSTKPWLRVVGGICLVFAVMNEQFALLSFGISLYVLLHKKIERKNNILVYLLISGMGLTSAFVSPGNAIRKVTEMKTFYNNFNEVSLLRRIVMSFLDTSDILFSRAYPFMVIVLGMLFLLAILKKKYMAMVAAAILFLV